jgi:hypothetical protein
MNQKLINTQKKGKKLWSTFQFTKGDKKIDSNEIYDVIDGLQKKAGPNARIHISGVNQIGKQFNLKGFTEDYSADEWEDYFKNKVKVWKDFGQYYQIEATVEYD